MAMPLGWMTITSIKTLDGAEGLCGDAPSHEETVRKYPLWSFEDQKAGVERGEVQDLGG